MIYLYALVPGQAPNILTEAILPGATIEAVPHGALSAVISVVPDDVFGEAALQAHIEDADWTRARALAHAGVVAALAAQTSVLPLKFGTLFHDRAGLLAMLDRNGAALAAALGAIAGAQEWGVKLFHTPDALRATLALPDATLPGTPGLAFFAQKKRDQQLNEALARAVAGHVASCHDRLASLSRHAVRAPLQAASLHGRGDDMVLNAAYLVDKRKTDALRAALRDLGATLAPLGFDIVLTGPWAPYSFARPDLAPPDDAHTVPPAQG